MSAISAAAMRVRIDMTGQRFGALQVVEYAETINRQVYWKCVCDCGKECLKLGIKMRGGETASCGCRQLAGARAARFKGGHRRSSDPETKKFYALWSGMRARCNNPNHKDFKYYGGRGIAVCERWASFQAFKDDMWPRPAGLTLDRKDVNAGYAPENCRWATWQEQRANQRRMNK
jgi:hypothetical protein